MRTLKIIQHVSLDGVIQAGQDTDGGFAYGDWSGPYRSSAGLAMVLREWGESFDLLIGRKTYDLWSAFWPQAPSSPMGDRLKAATKFVATHRPESLGWGPCEAVGPDVVSGVRAVKARSGPPIVLAGSSTLTSAVIEHGLAEEMLLLVNPVLLGKGKRLFAEGTPPRSFTLTNSRVSPTGILAVNDTFAGPLSNLT